jgi:hypothetical protein
MIDSVRRNGGRQEIWVLCLTAECERILHFLNVPGVKTLTLDKLEAHLPALLAAKADRNIVEYYFTCMAALHRYLFDTLPYVEGTMYIDADIEFYANPQIVFDAIGEAPVAIIPHNFSPSFRKKGEKFGLYNAGWSAFRRSREGMACLDWWLERSIEWCFDHLDGYRYANQGYLVRFKEVAPNTKILVQKGFNCAPWNIGNYRVTERGGRLLVDEEPLVFFHFHGVKKHYGVIYFDGHRDYGAPMSSLVRNRIYRPYIQNLVIQETRVRELARQESGLPLRRGPRVPGARIRELRSNLRKTIRRGMDLLAGRPILIWRDRAW